MTQDISHEHPNLEVARTASGDIVIVQGGVSAFHGADAVLIERNGGTRELARLVGRLDEAVAVVAEGRVVAGFRLSPTGRSLAEMTDLQSLRTGGGYDWGALGLPNGLDTRAVPISEPVVTDDLAAARASSGASEAERHSTLLLAPGDRFAAGSTSGTIVAIDRRAGIVDIDSGNGDPTRVPLDALMVRTDEEQRQ